MHKKRVLCGKFAHLFFLFYNPIAYGIRFFSKKEKKNIPPNPKILLCCWASLGDVLLASSVIDPIKKKWPEAKIGFLCAPDSFSLVKDFKKIDQIHQVPSWMVLGQGKIKNLCSLMYHFFYGYIKALQELKEAAYDISIELHPFFPNALPLAFRAKIPMRIGFTSGGYDVWITDPVALKEFAYLPSLYPLLLKKIGIKEEMKPAFPCKKKRGNKIVIHMGTSDLRKAWDVKQFTFIAKALKEKGYEILLTGKGKKDRAFIEQSSLCSIAEDLCDQLEFSDLFKLFQEAALVISIDSFPVHLAALLNTPFIGLYLYNANVELWLPNSSSCYLFIKNTCVRRCKEKIHPRGIYVEEISALSVVSKALDLLGETS